jgi:NADH-ubiquinone oxidoreductase chain 3
MILLCINFFIAKKTLNYREKNSSFECGFDPISLNHLPFRNQFFLISLIFLIFDIEITLLIPLIYIFSHYSFISILTPILFIIILSIGLIIEYSEFSID